MIHWANHAVLVSVALFDGLLSLPRTTISLGP